VNSKLEAHTGFDLARILSAGEFTEFGDVITRLRAIVVRLNAFGKFTSAEDPRPDRRPVCASSFEFTSWGKDYERHLCSGRLLCVKNGMRLVVKRILVKSGSVLL